MPLICFEAKSFNSVTRDCNIVLSTHSTRNCALDISMSKMASRASSSASEISVQSSEYHVQESSL